MVKEWNFIFYKLGNGVIIMVTIRYFPLAVLSLSLVVSTLLPQDAIAESVSSDYLFNGETCNGRNTNSEAGKSLRRINGSLKNTHEEMTATVYCPIVLPRFEATTPGPTFDYRLGRISTQLTFIAKNPPVQEIVCRLSLVNFVGEVAASKRGDGLFGHVEGGPGHRGGIYLSSVQMEFTERDNNVFPNGDRFTIKCGLPPLSELTEVRVQTTYYKNEDDPQ